MIKEKRFKNAILSSRTTFPDGPFYTFRLTNLVQGLRDLQINLRFSFGFSEDMWIFFWNQNVLIPRSFNSFEIFYPILVNPLSPDQDKERQVSSLSIVCEYIINVYKTYLSGFVDFILCKGCICRSDFSDFHFTSLEHSDLHFILNGVYTPNVKIKAF